MQKKFSVPREPSQTLQREKKELAKRSNHIRESIEVPEPVETRQKEPLAASK